MNIKNIIAEDKTASIGISFDVPNEKEIIAIGSPDRRKMAKCRLLPNVPTACAVSSAKDRATSRRRNI